MDDLNPRLSAHGLPRGGGGTICPCPAGRWCRWNREGIAGAAALLCLGVLVLGIVFSCRQDRRLKELLLTGGMGEFNLHTIPAREMSPRRLEEAVDCLP